MAILWFFGTGATATGVKYSSLRRVLPCERQGRPWALVFKPWRIAFAVAAVYIVLYCVFWSESLSSHSPDCVALQTSVHLNSCHTSVVSNPNRSVNSQSLHGQRDTGFGFANALSDTPGFVSTGLTSFGSCLVPALYILHNSAVAFIPEPVVPIRPPGHESNQCVANSSMSPSVYRFRPYKKRGAGQRVTEVGYVLTCAAAYASCWDRRTVRDLLAGMMACDWMESDLGHRFVVPAGISMAVSQQQEDCSSVASFSIVSLLEFNILFVCSKFLSDLQSLICTIVILLFLDILVTAARNACDSSCRVSTSVLFLFSTSFHHCSYFIRFGVPLHLARARSVYYCVEFDAKRFDLVIVLYQPFYALYIEGGVKLHDTMHVILLLRGHKHNIRTGIPDDCVHVHNICHVCNACSKYNIRPFVC